jgi:predicted enzyme related to lactoylglutathione lyase
MRNPSTSTEERIMTKPGEPCWIELFTPDTDAAAAFYAGLFGWTATEPDEAFGGYRMFLRDGEPVAGLMRNDGTMGGPSAWSVYLSTDDAVGTADKARAAHAQVVVEPMQVGDLGHMTMVVDPAGAAVGAWQPLSFTGFTRRPEDGAPVWFETLSRDYEKSVAFYTEVFGWETTTMSDIPELRYTTLGKDEDARAGIMDAAGFLGDQPSRWQFYVQVPDTDVTVEQAVAAGATLAQPVDDTPYGRLGVLTDPAGVQFHVMGPNRQAT